MKLTAFLSFFAIIVLMFISCQKEHSLENGPAISSSGSLKTISGDCIPSHVNGLFRKGITVNDSNYIDITINVTIPGSYIVSSDTINGIHFKAAGVFIATGLNTVRLHAAGTPLSGGTFPFIIVYGNTTCAVDVLITDATTPAAVFTLGGAGGACTGVTLNGTYTAQVGMTSVNTATIDVAVTTTGTYSISTVAVNGVTFSATGTFTASGNQQVTLNATGAPTTGGNYNFSVVLNSTTCTFPVTFLPAAAPAVFTLSGAPANCTTPVINGTYVATAPMNGTNSVVIKVDVTTIGSYTITTNTVNGMSFSGSGVFATTGTGIDVTLAASGTPLAAGTSTFSPIAGTSTCTFDIVTTAAPSGIFNCKIDGVYTSFYDRAVASIDDSGTPYLYLDGFIAPPNGDNIPELQIFISENDGSEIGAGSYNVDGYLVPGYRIEIDYKVNNPDLSVTIWNTSSTLFSPNPPFTITVTSITSTRVKGTFSGSLTNIFEGSTSQKTVTEGTFDLPIQ